MKKERQVRKELKHQAELLNKAKTEEEKAYHTGIIRSLKWVLEL